MPGRSVKVKIIIAVALFLWLQLVLGLWITNRLVTDFTNRSSLDQLTHSREMVKRFLELRKENLEHQGALLGVLPIMATVIENRDQATLRDTSEGYRNRLGIPIFDIYDADGLILVSMSQDAENSKLLRNLINQSLEQGVRTSSYMLRRGRLALIVVAPVGLVEDPSGVLVMGFYLDNPFTAQLKQMSKADVTLLKGSQIFASTIQSPMQYALMGYLPTQINLTHPSDPTDQLWPGYLLAQAPIVDSRGHLVAQIVVQLSLTQSGELMSDIRLWGLVFGISLLCLSVLISAFYMGRIILGPIESVISVINQVEQSNDLTHRVQLHTQDEIGQIGDAFNRLMDSQQEAIADLTASEEENRKLSRTVEQSPVTIVITDLDGIIQYVNPHFTQLTGYTFSEVLGHNSSIISSGETQNSVYKNMWDDINAGRVWSGEFYNQTKGGRKFIESATISPIFNERKQITHFVAIKEDITLRKAAEQELIQAKLDAQTANLAKSEFLANMSHEIRTPMNAILSMTSLLLESNLDQDQSEQMEIVNHSTEALLNIINDILDLSKIESGRLELFNDDFSLVEEINGVIEVFATKFRSKKIDLQYEVPTSLPALLYGDGLRIRQVLINLVGNALKFTARGSVVVKVVETSHTDNQFVLELGVSDTGVGIAEDRMERVFESFTQAESSTTKRFGGTGLGLTISKKLVNMMGGEIWADSVLGEGSTFYFTIPFGLSSAPASTKPVIPEVLHDIQGVRILLVEDNMVNQRVAIKILEAGQAKVSVANHGKEALEVLQQHEFDIILMDVQMPVMDGLETSRRIRDGEGGNPKTPIIALTANAFAGDRKRCLDAGMSDYVAKPFRKTNLFRLIAQYRETPS